MGDDHADARQKTLGPGLHGGGGWAGYTAVASPGDLNGDGHDDLVARDTSGTLWFYAGRGNGRFAARVRIGGGWNGYTHLVGTGDLTGSGYGSLLAVDGAGVLWRYDGTGRGTFRARSEVSAGWGGDWGLF
ncbi:FG-GAP repeat domain-containing protein [Streptacidiphilus jiangxiensis]|uniref:Repeat domain-containing protein n=1 Tax=Streptacidiphilus jiangxiensis TaxID=235985 RepID=A0A1H7JUC3_STRJI|nr:VCBS repeat-containing protein [Streptacidiphilus jiangxiensis]SEK77347.1 Repeat domain-containing protein [Streptacidiphilus jiangxiensis]